MLDVKYIPYNIVDNQFIDISHELQDVSFVQIKFLYGAEVGCHKVTINSI